MKNIASPNLVQGMHELKQRLVFVFFGLVIFRVGAHIPVPGIDAARLAELFSNTQTGILGLVNMFSGGALQRLSLFALGIMPYISASIIMQLLSHAHPKFEQLKKEGDAGRRKLSQYTRYGALVLSIFNAFGMSRFLMNSGAALSAGPVFLATTTLTLAAGTMFLVWLGERITEKGIGNGISLLIFAGVVSGLPSAFTNTLELVRQGLIQPIMLVVLAALFAGVMAFIVFIERAQRRIAVNYARRAQGPSHQQGSHLPLKINMAGVIPPIFASSLVLFPATLTQWFGGQDSLLAEFGSMISPGQPLYIVFLASGIMFFCFFYTALVFNPKETADNLKRANAFIPGIRPGDQTAKFIDKVMTRLTLIGGLYITAVALLPEFLILGWQVPFYFGGTSLLIVVVVVMDFISQVQSHLMSQQYESLMKKAKVKGDPSNFNLFN